MCLLVIQHQDAPKLSHEWLEDFYLRNQDGVGLMYAEDGTLYIEKTLPKNAEEWIDFYDSKIHGKFCAFHLRMRTHGEINLVNCHPYEVLNKIEHGLDLWLMHNGVLEIGNKSDPRKSDTWHYIDHYLKPMLKNHPDFSFTDAFKSMIQKHIGTSNKFVLMDNTGRYQVINQSSGLKWGGLWLSNTYAWSAPLTLGESKKRNWKSEVQEQPRKRYSLKPLSSTQGYLYEDDEDVYSLIEQYISDFAYYGFEKATEIDFRIVDEFISEFGTDGFFELAEMLTNGNITEKDFINTMKNPQKNQTYLKRSMTRNY